VQKTERKVDFRFILLFTTAIAVFAVAAFYFAFVNSLSGSYESVQRKDLSFRMEIDWLGRGRFYTIQDGKSNLTANLFLRKAGERLEGEAIYVGEYAKKIREKEYWIVSSAEYFNRASGYPLPESEKDDIWVTFQIRKGEDTTSSSFSKIRN
jgi:hypothetical protein